MPIIILIGIPVFVTILSYQIAQPAILSVLGYEIVPVDLLYVVVFIYALSPLRHHYYYLQNKGTVKLLVRFRTVKKILYIIIPVFLVLVIIEKIVYAELFDFIFQGFFYQDALKSDNYLFYYQGLQIPMIQFFMTSTSCH
jgi:hypothetical protein